MLPCRIPFYSLSQILVVAGDDQDISPVEIPLVDLQLVSALVQLRIREAALRVLAIGITRPEQAAEPRQHDGTDRRPGGDRNHRCFAGWHFRSLQCIVIFDI